MRKRDYTQLLAELAEAYIRHSPKSAALNERAKQYLVDGGSHALRLIQPFPPRIVAARGAWLKDEDGHDILDFWQGHLANVLGHNPEIITSALARAFAEGFGLQTGFADRLQVETAEILCRRTGAERVRFTTSGSLATMYAILLARAFTGRDLVMKVGGGWHGAQPWARSSAAACRWRPWPAGRTYCDWWGGRRIVSIRQCATSPRATRCWTWPCCWRTCSCCTATAWSRPRIPRRTSNFWGRPAAR